MQQSKINKAIIFAAGTGSRLGDRTKDIPKTLLQVGSLTIFDRMVMSLYNIGVRHIIVVVGFASEKLRSHVSKVTTPIVRGEVEFEFIENVRLDIGNIHSFWLAREKMNENFLLLNSDVVFHQGILELLASSRHESALSIDDQKQLGEEEMKVLLHEGSIKEISKKIDPKLAKGEYIGLMKLSTSDAQKVLERIQIMMKEQQFPLYYEDAIRSVVREENCLFACSTEGLSWTEIDTPEDLSYATGTVLPKLDETRDGVGVVGDRIAS